METVESQHSFFCTLLNYWNGDWPQTVLFHHLMLSEYAMLAERNGEISLPAFTQNEECWYSLSVDIHWWHKVTININ